MGTANSTNSYLTPPQLMGSRNSDGTYTLSALDIKALNDFNYRVASMIQGELNFANLNKATNDVFTGKVSFIDLSDPTSETVINGGLITTGVVSADRVSGGTLEGVTIVSTGGGSGQIITIQDGEIVIGDSVYGAVLKFDGTKVVLDSVTAPLKINSLVNMSIDAGGTIYIGTSNVNQQIEIGSATATINLNGATINKNGVPL